MRVWVDADACPVPVKDIVLNAALRRAVDVTFVANKPLVLPPSCHIVFVQVGQAADAADLHIREHAGKSDLVVTADIPLAHSLVTAGVVVIDPRGGKYTEDNIGDRLSLRDLMRNLRDIGEVRGGPTQFGDKAKRTFAATFDRELTRLLRIDQKQTGV